LIALLTAPLRFPTHIFSKISTPAAEVRDLSFFVLIITAGIFFGVSAVLVYALIRFRGKPSDGDGEPAQVFGSTQIELAWTIIPVLLIIVLFLGTARIIFAVQDAPKPAQALDVIAIGHQFWWEYRYPKYGVVTANELHIPVSDLHAPTPTFLKLTSADVMHSFWVPKLAGKTDLLPNRVNEMWVDPHEPGFYEGQCAQFCGPQHAKMLLRVYVDTPAQFQAWLAQQELPQQSGTQSPVEAARQQPNPGEAQGIPINSPQTYGELSERSGSTPRNVDAQAGRTLFEQQACMNCHTIAGTPANGRYGPDLTHLMSRSTIASGIVANNRKNLQDWIADPNQFKPGSLMPAMHLTDRQNAQLAAYLTTLQ
jgi:cytochrome c oxidase subunit II